MRRDREDELNLAHIGGKTDPAAHGASIPAPGRARQGSTLLLRFPNRTFREQNRRPMGGPDALLLSRGCSMERGSAGGGVLSG
jgi:hypothetical protein